MPSWTRFTSRWWCSTGISAWSRRAARSTRLLGWFPTTLRVACFTSWPTASGTFRRFASFSKRSFHSTLSSRRMRSSTTSRRSAAARLLLNARQVFDEANPNSAILLAIEDVTHRRAAEREKDELLREKEMLLEEMRHRVANSLQIIASILLLKARTVQSEETRRHLQDAHQRVMSVATVQEQLRGTGHGDRIEIGPYLDKLCDSLAKSMIGADRSVAVVVKAGAGAAVSGQAVSIGLIVTELLINAVKHAFPAERSGNIRVGYDATGSGWRLSVSDDGVGRSSKGGQPTSTGLGTSIVEALAHQLDARVEVSSGPQGTTVSVIHDAPSGASDGSSEGWRVARGHHPRRAAAQASPQGRSPLRRREVGEWSPAEPATATIPAAAAKQQNDKYNNEKSGRIHDGVPHVGGRRA